MKPSACLCCALASLAVLTLAPPSASAQNWMTDARRIGMGGVGGSSNLASDMIESPEGPHATVVIPLGLFQVLGDLDIYRPSSDEFDPIRATDTSSRRCTTRSTETAPGRASTSSTTCSMGD